MCFFIIIEKSIFNIGARFIIITRSEDRKCIICSFISEVSKAAHYECNRCGNTDEDTLVIYPIEAASSFLNAVYANIHDLDEFVLLNSIYDFEEFETTSLFLCATYEVLLETLIFDALTFIKTPRHVSDLLPKIQKI